MKDERGYKAGEKMSNSLECSRMLHAKACREIFAKPHGVLSLHAPALLSALPPALPCTSLSRGTWGSRQRTAAESPQTS